MFKQLHPRLNPDQVAKNNEAALRKKHASHMTDSAKLRFPPLDVKRDIPSTPRRPGSLDAFRLPSRTPLGAIVPRHHDI